MGRHTSSLNTWKIRYVVNGVNKTALVNVRDHEHAKRLASNYPNYKSISKVDYYRVVHSEIALNKLSAEMVTTRTPMMMDEIFLKRMNRIANKDKDKKDY